MAKKICFNVRLVVCLICRGRKNSSSKLDKSGHFLYLLLLSTFTNLQAAIKINGIIGEIISKLPASIKIIFNVPSKITAVVSPNL